MEYLWKFYGVFFHGELIDHSKIIDGLIYGLIIDELLMMIDGLLMTH